LGGALCGAQTAGRTLQAKVDERVELLSVVFHLAGNPEYNMGRLDGYTGEIDRYFGPYKGHAAVVLAKRLADQNGVSFDAVMAMAVSLSQPPELKPQVPFSDAVPEARWGGQNAELFAADLQSFYKDTKADVFFRQHATFYAEAERRFDGVLQGFDAAWFAKFYGVSEQPQFHLVLGLNNGGGNYGPRVVYPDGRQEFYAVMGAWSADGTGAPAFSAEYLPTVIHEFNHSYVNPAVHRAWPGFVNTAAVFRAVAEQMQEQAYGSPETLVDESLVRADVILYFENRGDAKAKIDAMIHDEQARGFVWMEELVVLLREYESQRDRYPTFAAFLPRVEAFYAGLAPRIPGELASFDASCAHVVSVGPMENFAKGVDPAMKQIVVRFDKAMDPGHISINYSDEGKEHYPVAGTPVFAADGMSLRVPVALKAGMSYGFVLTPLSFRSVEGYPLKSFTVGFSTK
jgi:hypothetical protein